MIAVIAHPCSLCINPKGTDVLSLKRLLLQNRYTVQLVLQLGNYTNSPISHLSLNFSLCVHCNFICLISFQNHIFNDIKIHQLRRGLI